MWDAGLHISRKGVDPEGLFAIACLSKPIITAMAMDIIREKRSDLSVKEILDTKLRELFPEAKWFKWDMTLWDLLNLSSGLDGPVCDLKQSDKGPCGDNVFIDLNYAVLARLAGLDNPNEQGFSIEFEARKAKFGLRNSVMICNECELKDLKKSVPKINFGKRKEETRILHGNNILATCEAFKNFIDVIKSDENFDFLFNGGITLHDHHLNMQRNESIEWCMGGFVKSEQGTILMQGDSGSHHTFCMIKGEKVIVIMTSSSHTAQFLHEWLFFESEETIEVPKWLAVKQIRGYSSEIIVSDKRKLDALRD